MGINHSKALILHSEAAFTGRKVTVFIVKEKLGY